MAEKFEFHGKKIEFQGKKSSFKLFGKIEFPPKRTEKSLTRNQSDLALKWI